MKVKIYCLYNPVTLKIRYIGRTRSKLKVRLSQHISKSRNIKKYYPDKKLSHKQNWINSLLKKGIKPHIKLLTIVDGWENSHIIEKNLIKKYLIKHNLVNGDDRGSGYTGAKSVNPKTERIRIQKIKNFYKDDNNKSQFYNKVYAYDLNGNFIREYKSLKFLIEETGLDYLKVQNQMHGKRKPVGDFYYSNHKYEKYPYLKSKFDMNITYLSINNEIVTLPNFVKNNNLTSWDNSQLLKLKFTKRVSNLLIGKKLTIIKKGIAVLERNF